MSVRTLAATLFRSSAARRPEIEAILDSELNRHEQVMRQLLNYALTQESVEDKPGAEDGRDT